MRRFYTVEHDTVTEVIGKAYLMYPRVGEWYNALTWRLERDPYPNEAIQIAPDTFVVKSENWDYAGF